LTVLEENDFNMSLTNTGAFRVEEINEEMEKEFEIINHMRANFKFNQ
jgi:hypothetical protein